MPNNKSHKKKPTSGHIEGSPTTPTPGLVQEAPLSETSSDTTQYLRQEDLNQAIGDLEERLQQFIQQAIAGTALPKEPTPKIVPQEDATTPDAPRAAPSAAPIIEDEAPVPEPPYLKFQQRHINLWIQPQDVPTDIVPYTVHHDPLFRQTYLRQPKQGDKEAEVLQLGGVAYTAPGEEQAFNHSLGWFLDSSAQGLRSLFQNTSATLTAADQATFECYLSSLEGCVDLLAERTKLLKQLNEETNSQGLRATLRAQYASLRQTTIILE